MNPTESETRIPTHRLYPHSTILEILRRVEGGESLSKVCESPGMPHRVTVHQWIAEDAELATQYSRAVQIAVAKKYAR